MVIPHFHTPFPTFRSALPGNWSSSDESFFAASGTAMTSSRDSLKRLYRSNLASTASPPSSQPHVSVATSIANKYDAAAEMM